MYVFLHLYCFHVLRYFFIVLFGLVWVTTPSVLVPDAVFPGDINRQAFPISLSSSSLLLLLLLLFFCVLSCHNYAVKFYAHWRLLSPLILPLCQNLIQHQLFVFLFSIHHLISSVYILQTSYCVQFTYFSCPLENILFFLPTCHKNAQIQIYTFT